MSAEISIVLPVYNGEKLLGESIESVINQTFSNWELIVVNDCSTDGTRDIIERYVSKDDRIKIVNNEANQKLPRSLNIGFKHAKGKYLTWTSDDNQYYPRALEEMYLYLESHSECPMVCANEQIIDNNNTEIDDWFDFDVRVLPYLNCVGACFLYRNEVLNTVGEYDPEMFLVEDYDYWLRILMKYGDIGYIAEKLYQYRWHDNSLSKKHSNGVIYQRNILRKRYLNYILESLNKDRMESEIFLLFCELKENGMISFGDIVEFCNYLPELKNMLLGEIENEKKIIAYGAGKIGEELLAKHFNEVVCFVDSDKVKVGKELYGKKIISLDELKSIYKNYNVVISVNKHHQLDIMKILFNYGIEFRIYS